MRVVAVADADDDRAYAAVRAGAVGVYLWSDPVSPVTEVVAGVARGEGVLTPGWAGRLVDEVGWLNRESSPLRAPELTPTELEVVRRVASGATAAAVAALHGVTEHVVNVHAGIVVDQGVPPSRRQPPPGADPGLNGGFSPGRAPSRPCPRTLAGR